LKAPHVIQAGILTLLFAWAAGGTGMAFHYRARAVQTTEDPQKAETAPRSSRQAAPAADSGPAGAAGPSPLQDAGLADRVRELETQLGSSANLIASLQASQTSRWSREDRPRRDRNDWMEELKATDPERYQEIMERRAEARRRMSETFAVKAAHFLDRDTSLMSRVEEENYHHMISLLDETWRIAEKLNTDTPREERWPLMRQMHENIEVLSPLLDAQREREFRQIALDFGYDDMEAAQFVEYMNKIVDVTTMRSFFESMRAGGPPGSGGRRGSGGPR